MRILSWTNRFKRCFVDYAVTFISGWVNIHSEYKMQ